jgi:LacI family transcriptional regulator
MCDDMKMIALCLPAALSYRHDISEGVAANYFRHHRFKLVELPLTGIGKSPFDQVAQLDGIITWTEERDTWLLDYVNQGIPVVNCGMEWMDHPGIANVFFDYPEMHQVVIDHLRDLAVKRVVVMGHDLEFRPQTTASFEEFIALAGNAGLSASRWQLDGKSPVMQPQRLLERVADHKLMDFLRHLPKPSAIFCASDHMAFIVGEAAQELGLMIPDDIMIIGRGNSYQGLFANPPLTSVAGNARGVGEQAALCLMEWLKTGQAPFLRKVVSGSTLHMRESTSGKSGNVALEMARRVIQQEAPTGLSLNEVVHLSKLSAKTFVLRYQEAFGLNPSEEIQDLRYQHCRNLLEELDLSLADVASQCGFSSQAAFSNYFQRHAQMTPSEYRARTKRRAS